MKKKIGLAILTVLLLVVMLVYVFIKNVESNLEALEQVQVQEVNLTQVQDGIYTGQYGEIPVSAEVSVTVKDHTITAIQIVKHVNGQGKPAEVITESVIKAQSLQVDAISDATYSSKVILLAISDALSDKMSK